ncbi:MAG: biopolymer transporter ExbD [Syntrophotaleaceae bacterium]
MSFMKKKREAPRIDLTPMVDVVFLLLIFFMISTTFVEAPGISIKLPESTSQQRTQEPEEVKVYLSREGNIYLGDEQVDQDELRRRLDGYRERAGRMTFLLLADQEARHGKVVALMDMAKETGFEKLAIATEYPEKRRPGS